MWLDVLQDRKYGQKFTLHTPTFNKKHSSNRVQHHSGILGRGSKINNNQCRFRTLWDLCCVFQLLYSLFLYDCVFLVRCEGMSCYRSNFSSWKRRREALTSSRAATGPSGCSVCPTTACFFRSGLQLQRPSSSPVISVSGIFRCDWNLYRRLSWLALSPFLFLFWKLNSKNSHWALSHASKLLQLRRNDRFNDAVPPCVMTRALEESVLGCDPPRLGGCEAICAGPSKAPLSRHIRTTSDVCCGITSFWASMRLGDIENIDYIGFKLAYWRVIFRLRECQYFSSWLFHHRPQPSSFSLKFRFPPDATFESNFSSISCSVFIFSGCGL